MSIKRSARINVKALITLGVIAVFLAGGAAVAYKVRKRMVASAALDAGKAAIAQEDWPEACKQLRLYLSKYPDDEKMLYAYADANRAVRPMQPGNMTAAAAAYRRVLRWKPDDMNLYARLAQIYLTLGNYSDADHIAGQCGERFPNHPRPLLWSARALTGQRSAEDAIATLKRLVDPSRREAMAGAVSQEELQSALLQGWSMLANLTAAEASNEGNDEAMRWAEAAVVAYPDEPQSWALQAHIRRITWRQTDDDNDSSRAIAQIRKTTNHELERAEGLNPTDPVVLLSLAEERAAWQEFDQAMSHLSSVGEVSSEQLEALDMDPEVFAFARHTLLARVTLGKGDPIPCAAVAEQARAALGRTAWLRFAPTAIELLLAGRDIEQARAVVEEYREAYSGSTTNREEINVQLALIDAAVSLAEVKPYDTINLLDALTTTKQLGPVAWRLLWQAYRQTQQDRRAMVALEKYIELRPDDYDMRLALADALRATDPRKSMKHAQWLEQLRPDALEPKLLRIDAMFAGGGGPLSRVELRTLSDELTRLETAYPDRKAVAVLQATAKLAMNQGDDALTMLREMFESDESTARSALQLVDQLLESGDTQGAIDIAMRAIERYPELAEARATLAAIYTTLDRQEDAQNVLEQAVRELKGDARMTVAESFIRLLLVQNRRDEAVALLEQLRSELPYDVRPRVGLLAMQEIRASAPRAEQLVEEIREIEGEQGLTWRFEKARALLADNLWRLENESGRQRRQEIESLLSRCSESDPSWTAVTVTHGAFLEQLARFDAAEEVYRRALGAGGDERALSVRLMLLLERMGRFTEADSILQALPKKRMPVLDDFRLRAANRKGKTLEELERRVANDTRDVASRITLARALYSVSSSNFPRCHALLAEAESIEPENISIVGYRVALLLEHGENTEAQRLLDDLVETRPEFASYRLRAGLYERLGMADQALADYTRMSQMPGFESQGCASLGRYLLSTGAQDEALAAWRRGLEGSNDDVNLAELLAGFLVRSDNPVLRKEGNTILERFLATSPDNGRLLLMQAVSLLKDNTTESMAAAESTLGRLVHDIDPRAIEAHVLLVSLAAARGDQELADSRMQHALARNPLSERLQMLEARRLLAAGDLRTARKSAELVLGRKNGNVDAMNLLAELSSLQGDGAQAREWNLRALATDPGNIDAIRMRATFLMQDGELDQAAALLQKVRQDAGATIAPRDLMLLGVVQLRRNDFEAVQALIASMRSRDADDPGAMLLEMQLWRQQGDLGKIRLLASEADSTNPQKTAVLAQIAEILASSEQPAQLNLAGEIVERIVASAPEDIAPWLLLAKIRYMQGKPADASVAFKEVLQRDPQHSQALNDLAWILANDLNDPESALRHADEGLRLYPNNAHLHDTRGMIRFQRGQFVGADEDFKEALRLSADVPATYIEASLHLARLHAKTGNANAARAHAEEAISQDETYHVLDEADQAELRRIIDENRQE